MIIKYSCTNKQIFDEFILAQFAKGFKLKAEYQQRKFMFFGEITYYVIMEKN